MIPTVEKRIDTDFMVSAMSYDPETGIITWSRNRTRAVKGRRAGSVRTPKKGRAYRVINHQGAYILEHRIAWFFAHGEWPRGIVDHINGDGCDNRLCNLRVVNHSQNSHNVIQTVINPTGFIGVHYRADRGKYRAGITVDGKKHYLGLHDTKEQAAKAYRDAARELVGPLNRSNAQCTQQF
jgi:hypothetical protein